MLYYAPGSCNKILIVLSKIKVEMRMCFSGNGLLSVAVFIYWCSFLSGLATPAAFMWNDSALLQTPQILQYSLVSSLIYV
jgi:hypothetical protein